MYIKSINVRNIGPIKQCTIKPTFDKNGNPNLVVIIGENGTGKSYISSYICDSLIELSRIFYTNAVVTPNSYFRYISGENISFGEKYSLVNIDFENEGEHTYYDERCGTIPDDKTLIDKFVSLYDSNDQKRIKDDLLSKNHQYLKKILLPTTKRNSNDKNKFIREIFTNNILCYFPADRTEIPHWLNEASIKTEEEISSDNQMPNERSLYTKLDNAIIADSSAKENALWIDKIMYDCSLVFNANDKNELILQGIPEIQTGYLRVKGQIENCLKLILKCENVQLVKSLPGSSNRYDIVCYKKGNEEWKRITNINQLSLGESVLFNIFTTILRYAEQNIMVLTSDISDFRGIVIIDEIDVHLDTDMQYEILPQLLALFPKIQFIITTHSPLFLLGLEKYKKEHEKDYDLIEMPTGSHISVEKFSEFEKAFNALTNTNKEEEKISKLLYETINDSTNVPNKSILLVTEGKTDVKHINWALEKFKAEGEYNDLNILFLDYKDNDTLGNGQMSKYEAILSLLPKFDNGLKVVFLYDIDKGKYSEDFSYKKHGPSAYSFQLPLPDTRKENKTPEELKKLSFSIEHLFTDEEIKKEYVGEDNISRRLYMGNEFDSCGNSKNGLTASLRNKCGDGKLDIIDASNGGVKKTGEADQPAAINYALSKDDFYEHIVADENQNIGHIGFKGLFNKLLEIANDN